MLRITSTISSKVVPYAVRSICSRGSITNESNGCDKNSSTAISHHQFSSDAGKKQIDDKLVKIIKSEIKLRQTPLKRDVNMLPALIPDELPFTIIDNPWESHVTLSRDFDGEKIDVVVRLPFGFEPQYLDEECDPSIGTWLADAKKSTHDIDSDSDLSLRVTISKNGKIMLIFYLYACASGSMGFDFVGYSLKIQEPARFESEYRDAPRFMYRDVKPDWIEFLRVRGIEKSNYVFLFDYMYKKYKKYPVVALKKLRNFIAE